MPEVKELSSPSEAIEAIKSHGRAEVVFLTNLMHQKKVEAIATACGIKNPFVLLKKHMKRTRIFVKGKKGKSCFMLWLGR